jgi:hypothetical protein
LGKTNDHLKRHSVDGIAQETPPDLLQITLRTGPVAVFSKIAKKLLNIVFLPVTLKCASGMAQMGIQY